MGKLKKVCLLFLSILCFFLTAAAQPQLSETDSLSTKRFAIDISVGRGNITGILITKDENKIIPGTIINEFGVSAVSFIYDKNKNKLKLQEVMSMLNKWYIKRVLQKDLRYILQNIYGLPITENNNYLVDEDDGQITIINKKRKIIYTFHQIYQIHEDDTEE